MENKNSVPVVSVCIPTYNRKDYLKETLLSVFAQTYKDYEIVIVDDGSTDGTEEMIKQFGRNIRYHWQKNTGDAAARNKLLELAAGKYITLLDSDDLLMPDTIERTTSAMQQQTEPVIVYGPYLRIDRHGNVIGRDKRKLYTGFVTKYLFQDIFVHPNGSLFPKILLQQAGGFDESLHVCSDYDMWLRLSLKYRFIALPEPTFKRRRHLTNLSAGSIENRITELKVLERFYYEKGGNQAVSKNAAMKRFSEEEYRVGLCALKEKNYKQARDYFAKSFRKCPALKSLLQWTKAYILKGLNGEA
ncbi:MAG: glycosyltransferase [Phycisphaerae bacterium]|jgi:glycosyltransferase involved in cell wall biosynthesis